MCNRISYLRAERVGTKISTSTTDPPALLMHPHQAPIVSSVFDQKNASAQIDFGLRALIYFFLAALLPSSLAIRNRVPAIQS
jgi:hypothetical protein